MVASVRALLEHLVDYAGMFPPARLPLREALGQYYRLAAAPEAWMLGRFVCPAAQLAELRDAARTDGATARLIVAALGRGGRDVAALARGVEADRRDIERFRADGGAADVVELAVPAGLAAADLDRLAGEVLPVLAAADLRVFCEVPLTASWADDVAGLAARLARPAVPVGLKVRCGGTAVPSAEQLAAFIATCRAHGRPWKATAGLHHPLYHRDPATQTRAHGFLNVFAAGVLALVHGLGREELGEVLREEAASAFQFTDADFTWRGRRCTTAQVRAARAHLVSFGSCSFDEPRDDLRALGLV